MDALSDVVGIAPTDPRVLPLIETHLTLMHATSPRESVHALPPELLSAGGVRFFAILQEDAAIAMGALKPLGNGQGEIKSMHVREAHRGRGLADRMLAHLIAEARAAGMTEVLLETGSRPAFAPARAFYARHGFTECPPYVGYAADVESTFMRLPLDRTA
ncbi:GNAT family N-acetyltransferase [Seohaeicola zhoushanensis]|uniref:GCN5 family N-acetyltransferase n=1 Tax=Seohaeicola zhoushanensis TaxID=1569283 RepID=A0A8J3GUI1_9RHOB|nr:GNAT family N-acetyltransferase [Seohaeicola zhoushanensis]GHF37234.1 GCN5 family N-acetyltransferase [Seohaeicola zhoushanensis]